MTAYVVYQVPVWVQVDLDARRVSGVNVADESVDGPFQVHDIAGGRMSEADHQRAVAIAEAEDWPAWTLGP